MQAYALLLEKAGNEIQTRTRNLEGFRAIITPYPQNMQKSNNKFNSNIKLI
jgi:hypothetical protein